MEKERYSVARCCCAINHLRTVRIKERKMDKFLRFCDYVLPVVGFSVTMMLGVGAAIIMFRVLFGVM